MKTLTILPALIFTGIAFTACGDTRDSSVNNTPDRTSLSTPSRNANDSTMNSNMANSNTATLQDNFWANAAQGGMAEVEMSKLAQTKAQNAEVKKFAAMMVAEHTKANSELKALAAKQNVVLPTTLSSSHQSTLEDLRGLSGAEFDKAYVDAMVADHENDVELFREQAEDDDTANADVKAWAAKTLPTLQKHLDTIRGIQEKMGA